MLLKVRLLRQERCAKVLQVLLLISGLTVLGAAIQLGSGARSRKADD